MKLRFLLYLAIPCLILLSCEGGNEGEEGCTDPLAINYNTTATVDDGTCTYEGCTDPEAFNYDPAATVDNGECIYEGCTDPVALNYDPEASIDDGSCEYPPNPGSCSEVEFDGHTYAVVEIGLQCWFAENLQSTVFASGTSIEEVISDADWSALSTPGQCIYENEVLNLPDYGRLYNAFAVNSAEGLCPTGWHVPTTEDWQELELFAGVSVDEIDLIAEWRGTAEGVGTSLMATSGWDGISGTDLHGFDARPAGNRFYSDGSFFSAGSHGAWWTSSVFGDDNMHRALWNSSTGILQAYGHPRLGNSVRCLKN